MAMMADMRKAVESSAGGGTGLRLAKVREWSVQVWICVGNGMSLAWLRLMWDPTGPELTCALYF